MIVRYMFMHTLDGKPAFFDGDQIALFPFGRTFVRALVADIDTIQKQRKKSVRWRKAMGWDTDEEYSFIRIEVV